MERVTAGVLAAVMAVGMTGLTAYSRLSPKIRAISQIAKRHKTLFRILCLLFNSLFFCVVFSVLSVIKIRN